MNAPLSIGNDKNGHPFTIEYRISAVHNICHTTQGAAWQLPQPRRHLDIVWTSRLWNDNYASHPWMIWIIIFNYIIQIIDFNNNHMDNHPWMIIMIMQNNISHWLFWCHFMLHFWQWIPPCPATVPGPCWPDAKVGTNTRPATGDDMDSLVTELYASLINKGIKRGGPIKRFWQVIRIYSDYSGYLGTVMWVMCVW